MTKIISINGVPVAPIVPVSGSFVGPLGADLRMPSNQLPQVIDSRIEILSSPKSVLDTYVLGVGELANPTDRPYIVKGDGVKLGGDIVGYLAGNQNIQSNVDTSGSVVGNARGQGSVDLQQSRTSATGVAMGNFSVISGGGNNQADSPYSTVGGGEDNTIGGASSHSTISGGNNNNITASGYYGGGYLFIGGGKNNTVSGSATLSSIVGGYGNILSGPYSFIGGGTRNTASGHWAVIGGGASNTVTLSAYYATVGGGGYNTCSAFTTTIGGGRGNTASGYYSTVGGGAGNTASGYGSTVGGGWVNTASGQFSTVGGGQRAVADRSGMVAHASGRFSSDGDAQKVEFILRNKTTNATATTLFLNGLNAGLTIPNGKVMSFIIDVTGIRSDGSAVSYFVRKGAIKNVSNTVSLVGSIETIGTDIEDDAATDVAITANNTDKTLQINVTGVASQTWRWVAILRGTEIGYGT
jgi:hypothetical protein